LKTESDARNAAFDLVKDFCETMILAGRADVNYYKLLWVTHWGVEQYGPQRVKRVMKEMLKSLPGDSEDLAENLRDRLFVLSDDNMSAWFDHAMKV
jgi:hypothetical protein